MDKAKMTKVALAKRLGVSRSSLYYQSKKRASDEELKQKIIAVMTEHPACGHRRIALALTMNRWFVDRFWYVATVIDIFTREIVGWHIANHHTTALIMEAFSDATRRTKTASKYFHSDQGSEYVSGGYESLLAEHGTALSRSRKSSPWQNGFQESFYSQFKLELGNPNRFSHIGELIEAVHRQIAYYNNCRIHSVLKMSPIIFRQKQVLKYAAVAAS
jgi:transposase InsO family protein